MKNLLLVTATFLALTSAHHRCDDLNTASTNANAGPLAKALQKALSDKDAALKVKLGLESELAAGQVDVGEAEKNMLSAEAALKTSSGKVSAYHEDYAVKSKAVAECKPDAEGSTCTIDLKN